MTYTADSGFSNSQVASSFGDGNIATTAGDLWLITDFIAGLFLGFKIRRKCYSETKWRNFYQQHQGIAVNTRCIFLCTNSMSSVNNKLLFL